MTRLENILIEQIKECLSLYKLWEKEEPILLGVSGGKDSLVLMRLLSKMQVNFYPVHIKNSPNTSLNFSYSKEIQVIETDIYQESHRESGSKNPCYLCSRKRRKQLLEYAKSQKLKTICLAHNKNDVAETLLLNMIYSREISTIKPKQEIFQGSYAIVRPLFFTEEKLISAYCREEKLVIQANECPESRNSKRSYLRVLLAKMQEENPKIELMDNIFSSLKQIKADFLPFKIK